MEMDIMNKMVSMPEMIKKKFDLMAKISKRHKTANIVELLNWLKYMDENGEIAEGPKGWRQKKKTVYLKTLPK